MLQCDVTKFPELTWVTEHPIGGEIAGRSTNRRTSHSVTVPAVKISVCFGKVLVMSGEIVAWPTRGYSWKQRDDQAEQIQRWTIPLETCGNKWSERGTTSLKPWILEIGPVTALWGEGCSTGLVFYSLIIINLIWHLTNFTLPGSNTKITPSQEAYKMVKPSFQNPSVCCWWCEVVVVVVVMVVVMRVTDYLVELNTVLTITVQTHILHRI